MKFLDPGFLHGASCSAACFVVDVVVLFDDVPKDAAWADDVPTVKLCCGLSVLLRRLMFRTIPESYNDAGRCSILHHL